MAFTWQNPQGLGDSISPEWADEVRNAILQLVNDVYSNPVNSGDGSAQLLTPLEESIGGGGGGGAILSGEVMANGVGGQIVDVSQFGFSSASEYSVILTWQEDPGPNSGYLWVEKSASSFLIKNSGFGGKAVNYCVFLNP